MVRLTKHHEPQTSLNLSPGIYNNFKRLRPFEVLLKLMLTLMPFEVFFKGWAFEVNDEKTSVMKML